MQIIEKLTIRKKFDYVVTVPDDLDGDREIILPAKNGQILTSEEVIEAVQKSFDDGKIEIPKETINKALQETLELTDDGLIPVEKITLGEYKLPRIYYEEGDITRENTINVLHNLGTDVIYVNMWCAYNIDGSDISWRNFHPEYVEIASSNQVRVLIGGLQNYAQRNRYRIVIMG